MPAPCLLHTPHHRVVWTSGRCVRKRFTASSEVLQVRQGGWVTLTHAGVRKGCTRHIKVALPRNLCYLCSLWRQCSRVWLQHAGVLRELGWVHKGDGSRKQATVCLPVCVSNSQKPACRLFHRVCSRVHRRVGPTLAAAAAAVRGKAAGAPAAAPP